MSRHYDETMYEEARSAIKQLRNDARAYYEYYYERCQAVEKLQERVKELEAENQELLKFRAAFEALEQDEK